MHTISLDGQWTLAWAEGSPLMPPGSLVAETFTGRCSLPARVPAPVHVVLQEAGMLDDPNVGLNSLRARWVEEMFWACRHTFAVDAEVLAAPTQRLVCERLEYHARVWLNGEELGTHANAHLPAVFDVAGKLRAENLLVVLLDTGMHEASDQPAQGWGVGDIGALTKRQWTRRPQHQGGWDWHPRLMNVGILGSVRLEAGDGPVVEDLAVSGIVADDLGSATVKASLRLRHPGDAARPATLMIGLPQVGLEATAQVDPTPGEQTVEVTLAVPNPRLWWPVGHGEQHRYTVNVALSPEGAERRAWTRQLGLRHVAMDQSPHPVEGRYCVLQINGRPIFCKGGNWVPPDIFYANFEPERYRELVDLALGANFNLLRIWGGANYAEEALLEVCDEAGILVWHDFAFACGKYPGMEPAFAAEVQREVRHVVRERAHHPSLVVWCGNNEIEWGDDGWGYDRTAPTHPHYALFHRDIPRLCHQEVPGTLHWLSSPWSPDFLEPNNPTVGDQHPWRVSLLDPDASLFWQYRDFVDRFPNEGGVPGASTLATLRQFLPEGERQLFSPSWYHHDNPFSACAEEPGKLGRAYQTVQHWTGRDPRDLDLETYAFISGILQGEGLSEYIANYRRRMFSSAAAIFWMFNDSWPVSNGWTIVDYYRRKKLAYHRVRRANAPVTVVVAEEGRELLIVGVNDTPQAWTGEVEYGLFTLAGERPAVTRQTATLPANQATVLGRLPRADWEALGLTRSGAFAGLFADGRLHAQHRLFRATFGELEFDRSPQLTLVLDEGRLTVRAETFVWNVVLGCSEPGCEPPDNCFDVLPGIPYHLRWQHGCKPCVAAIGSRDVWR